MINPLLFVNEIRCFLSRHHYMSFTPKAALIDMDGTLYDSMPNHAAAWKRVMNEIGVDLGPEEIYLYEGATGAATIERLIFRTFGRHATEEEKIELYERKAAYFNELPTVRVMPGAKEMLEIFKKVGMKCVLVTGSGQKSVMERVERDFPGIFEKGMRISSRDVKCGKPHPEPYIKAMQLARVRPSEAIVIENAPYGVEAGDRAGAFTIGVSTGPIEREILEKAGAALVFPSMQDFAERLPLLLLSLLSISLEP